MTGCSLSAAQHVVLKDDLVVLAARTIWGVGYSGGQKPLEPVHSARLSGFTHSSVVEHQPMKLTVEGSNPSTLKNAKTGAAATREPKGSEKVSNSRPFGEAGHLKARKADKCWWES